MLLETESLLLQKWIIWRSAGNRQAKPGIITSYQFRSSMYCGRNRTCRSPLCIRRATGWPPERGSPAKRSGRWRRNRTSKTWGFFPQIPTWLLFSRSLQLHWFSPSEHYRLSWRVTPLTGIQQSTLSSLPISRRGREAVPLIRLEHSLKNRTIRINWMFHNSEFYGQASLALQHT